VKATVANDQSLAGWPVCPLAG